MNITDYAVKKAEVTVPFLDLEDVYITIAKLSSEDILAIRKKCSIGKRMNTATKDWEEQIDNEKFLRKYSDEVIIGWKGLKGKHLLELIMINLPEDKLEEDVECTSDNKYALLENSNDVDNFLSAVLNNVAVFNNQIAEQELKK